jgi:molecular chaperone HtpG
VSNAVDATQKLKALSALGEAKGDIGDTTIEVSVNKEAKTITIADKGIGMTAEEIEKYITQIAFSGATEFIDKYKDKSPEAGAIIGHFGLGFYSAFMVAKRVEIISLSHKEGAEAVHWSCEGDPEYQITKSDKKERGTTIILNVAEDAEEFLEDGKIEGLLKKYCKFLPVAIKYGTKKEHSKVDDKDVETEVDNIINNTSPAWTKKPVDLTDEDYKSFYRELYPFNFEDPLFHIHLNVDYPFNLTGILFFPKLKKTLEVQKDKIQLYSNQVFVTDAVENIVPDFLTLLRGVIDSPDIPLNVSRSYLQADASVKKISGHITKKVADKLEEIFKADRKDFEAKIADEEDLKELENLVKNKRNKAGGKNGK